MARLVSYFARKHVLITGGSSGIGLATARRLVEIGAEVTLLARRADVLERARAEVRATREGAVVHALPLDVSREDEVDAKLGEHLSSHPAQMLINNAGVTRPGRFLELDAGQFRSQMEINYFGAVNMCRVVVPRIIAQGGGHVTNVGSLLSVMSIYGYTAYAASKFALYGFSESLRQELLEHKVAISVLLPPDTDTPQHAEELSYLPAETRAIAGTAKMLTPESVAEALLTGMARGRFEIVPGLDSRLFVAASRWMPWAFRLYCDSTHRRVTAKKRSDGEVAHGTSQDPVLRNE